MNKFYIVLLLLVTQSIQPIQIKIITPENRTIKIDAKDSDTILDLKQKIAAKTNIPAREQILMARYMYMSMSIPFGDMNNKDKLSDILKQWNFDKVPVYVIRLSPDESNAYDQLAAIKEKLKNIDEKNASIEQGKALVSIEQREALSKEERKYYDLIDKAVTRATAYSESKITPEEKKQRNIGESAAINKYISEYQTRYDKLKQETNDLKNQLKQADPKQKQEINNKIQDKEESMKDLSDAIASGKEELEKYKD